MAKSLLGSALKSWKVEKVLVEEKLAIETEYYVGIIIDPGRDARCPVVMFSTEGGMDIEAVPEEKIARMNVDVLRGFHLYDALNLAVSSRCPQSSCLPSARPSSACTRPSRTTIAGSPRSTPWCSPRTGRSSPPTAASPSTTPPSSAIREFGIEVAREASTPPTELDKIAWWIEEGDLRGTSYIAQMVTEIKGTRAMSATTAWAAAAPSSASTPSTGRGSRSPTMPIRAATPLPPRSTGRQR